MICESFPSNMTRDAALRKFLPPGRRGLTRRWLYGNLMVLAEVYIPHRLYEVTIHDRGAQLKRYFAVDATSGTLDPYEFAAAPEPEELIKVETRNCHPVLLVEQQTQQLAIEAVRQSLYAKGFFRLNNPVITAYLVRAEIYMPYWAGFFGYEEKLELVMLNAVRQTYEGSKLRRLTQEWLLDR